MKKELALVVALATLCAGSAFAAGKYRGQWTVNEYSPNKYTPATQYETPKNLYDGDGNYRGKLSSDKYDPESVSNPYGKYGSKYSAESVNNPYGAGSKYKSDSPNNPYGQGWAVVEE